VVEIIGAGFGRTGTSSLKRALEILGFDPCHHMSEVLRQPRTTIGWTAALNGATAELPALLAGYRATLDFPGCLLWREMTELYPRAKVLLSVRDPKKWYDSARATIINRDRGRLGDVVTADGDNLADLLRPFSAAMAARGWRRDLSEADTIAVFQQHNDTVRATVEPEKLLVYEVTQGWEPLCAFLGVDVPGVPFPHANDGESFRQNVNRVVNATGDDFA
jgi:hypothetical protein